MPSLSCSLLVAAVWVSLTPWGGQAQSTSTRAPTAQAAEFQRAKMKQSIIIIDGVRASANTLAHFDSDRISTIEVVPNAQAVRRYGAGAKRGVVLVTTKVIPAADAEPPQSETAAARDEDGWTHNEVNGAYKITPIARDSADPAAPTTP